MFAAMRRASPPSCRLDWCGDGLILGQHVDADAVAVGLLGRHQLSYAINWRASWPTSLYRRVLRTSELGY